MAVLSTIVVIAGAWCAASVATVALYAALRRRHVRRQRAALSVPVPVRAGADAGRVRGPGGRPAAPSGRPARMGRGRRFPPADLRTG